MRKLSLLLFIFLFSFCLNSLTISSTNTGGYWSVPSTWVGEVVPQRADNVVITGAVAVDADLSCNDLTIDNTGILLGTTNYTLEIFGNTINNGSIIENLCLLSLSIHGSFLNNGNCHLNQASVLNSFINNNSFLSNSLNLFNNFTNNDTTTVIYPGQMVFSGHTNHLLINSGTSVLNANITASDSLETITLGSDLTTNSSVFTGNNCVFVPNDHTVNNTNINSVKISTSGSFNNCYFQQSVLNNVNLINCSLSTTTLNSNVLLSGIIPIGYGNTFNSFTIPNGTTIQPFGNWELFYNSPVLTTTGIFTNNGKIDSNNNWYTPNYYTSISLNCLGNVINNDTIIVANADFIANLENNLILNTNSINSYSNFKNIGTTSCVTFHIYGHLENYGLIKDGTISIYEGEVHNFKNTGTINDNVQVIDVGATIVLESDINLNGYSLELAYCTLTQGAYKISQAVIYHGNLVQGIIENSTLNGCYVQQNTTLTGNIVLDYNNTFYDQTIPSGTYLFPIGNWGAYYTPVIVTTYGAFVNQGHIVLNDSWYNSIYPNYLNFINNGSFQNDNYCHFAAITNYGIFKNNGFLYGHNLTAMANFENHDSLTVLNADLKSNLLNTGYLVNSTIHFSGQTNHQINSSAGYMVANLITDSLEIITLNSDLDLNGGSFDFGNCSLNGNTHQILNTNISHSNLNNVAGLNQCSLSNCQLSDITLNNCTLQNTTATAQTILNGMTTIDYGVTFNNVITNQNAILQPIGNWGAYYTPVNLTVTGNFTNNGQIKPNSSWYNSAYPNFLYITTSGNLFQNYGQCWLASSVFNSSFKNYGYYNSSFIKSTNIFENHDSLFANTDSLAQNLTNTGLFNCTNMYLTPGSHHLDLNTGIYYGNIIVDTLSTVILDSNLKLHGGTFNLNNCTLQGNSHSIDSTEVYHTTFNGISNITHSGIWYSNLNNINVSNCTLHYSQVQTQTALHDIIDIDYGVSFSDQTIGANTTLRPLGNWGTHETPPILSTFGNFVNNGNITINDQWYSTAYPAYLAFDAYGNMTNNGTWLSSNVYLKGENPRSLHLKNIQATVMLTDTPVTLTGNNKLRDIAGNSSNLTIAPNASLKYETYVPDDIHNYGTISIKHTVQDYIYNAISYRLWYYSGQPLYDATDSVMVKTHGSTAPNFPYSILNWYELNSYIPSVNLNYIRFVYHNTNDFNNNNENNLGVYYSPDNGSSWSRLSPDLYTIEVQDTVNNYIQIANLPSNGIYALSSYLGDWEANPMVSTTAGAITCPKPFISCSPVAGNALYHAQVSLSSDFNQTYSEKSSSTPGFRMNTLPLNTTFYLRARVETPYGTTTWSTPTTFTTRGELVLSLPDTLIFNEDTPYSTTLMNYINFAPDDSLTISGTGSPHLNISFENNNLHITPALNWNGLETISLAVNDNINPTNAGIRVNHRKTNRFIFNFSIPVRVLPINDLPVASNVQVSGIYRLGHTLTATYTFTDVDGTELNSLCQWYRVINNVNNPIPGANTISYLPGTSDVGYPLLFSVIPKDNLGAEGTIIYSSLTPVIQPYNVPEGLSGVLADNSITLQWLPPVPDLQTRNNSNKLVQENRTLIGFKVYRNFIAIATLPGTQTQYTDINLANGTYSYYVTALFSNPDAESGPSNTVTLTGVAEQTETIFITELHTNYPNPFNPSTMINFSLEKAGQVTLEIFNSRGQLVKTLVNSNMVKGKHQIEWNGRDYNNMNCSSGIYLCRLTTSDKVLNRKLTLMK